MRKVTRNLYRSIAWILIAACAICGVGESGAGMLKVQAKGKITASGGNSAEEIQSVLSLGRYYSAAIKADDSLWMWGSKSAG